MKVETTPIADLLVLTPEVFADERGYFFESYSTRTLEALGIKDEPTQMNQSFSKAGVLRGLHFQAPPFAQSKLVRCISGKLFDVAVDIRTGSPTLGKWYGLELSAENKKILYIPQGFAHGFLALTDCEMLYTCGNAHYEKSAEGGLRYNDLEINIAWPITTTPIVHERDLDFPSLSELKSPFTFASS